MKRVIAKFITTYNVSDDEHDYTLIQHLQEQRFFKLFGIQFFVYWKTIDTEIVPSYAWIQRNTMGSTDWKSKWHDIKGVWFTDEFRK